MSSIINSIVLAGNLTRDAEIKYFNNGNAIVKFSLAQNKSQKKGDQWVDKPVFFDVAYGGKGAEAVHKYLVKGKPVVVQGELEQDRWEQEGQARSKIYIKAFSVKLGGDRPGQPAGNDAGQNQAGQPDERFDDDLPF